MDLRHIFYFLFFICASACPEPNVTSANTLLGLPPTDARADDPKARLGERLFFDKRLSTDQTVSCGSCHVAEYAFSDRQTVSKGHENMQGTRNAPSLLNVTYMKTLFWDGRAADLMQQARAPFVNPVEHALPNEAALTQLVSSDASYAAQFARLWPKAGGSVRMEMITEALATYERTLLAGGSPFDRFHYAKERAAMSDEAIRGFELFRGRANCDSCHLLADHWSLFTDQQFHAAARGLPSSVSLDLPALAQRVVAAKNSSDPRTLDVLIATDTQVAALGRFLVTLNPADIGKFKTPSLRNVALTAPYMHDGGVATLEEAVDLELYSRGDITYPIVLTRSEKADLVAFLTQLSGVRRHAEVPTKMP